MIRRTKTTGKSARPYRLIWAFTAVILTTLLFVPVGCERFSLVSILDGEKGLALSVTPESWRMVPNDAITFEITGGYPPYRYSYDSVEGDVEEDTFLFIAPPTEGSITIRITDLVDSYVDVVVEVNQSAGVVPGQVPDYSNVSVLSTGGPNNASGPLTGSFTFQNTGTGVGADSVFWLVYASNDAIFDSGIDVLVATGSTIPLAASVTSSAIGFSGSWPSSAGTYYLIAIVAAGDDSDNGNNAGVSSSVAVGGPTLADIDYTTGTPANTGATLAGGTLTGQFTFTNSGADNGSSDVFWLAYTSIDATYDAGDTLFDSGSVLALTGGATSAPVVFSGSWPAIAGGYYVIVRTTAGDDINTSNNDGVSTLVTTTAPPAADIDYANVTPINTGALTSGAALDGTFTVTNTGTEDGVDTIFWSAYVSTDITLDGGDTLVDTGSTSSLAASATSGAIAVSGIWPTTPGNYYLIVDVNTDDDVNTGNNNGASGMVTTTGPPPDDVDYLMNAPANTGGTVAGAALSGTFVIDNLGVDAGSLDITWQLYVSTDATIDTGIDPLVASNTTSALAGGGSTGAIGFTGTWPSAPGSYYLLAKLSASDDIASGNDTAATGSIVVSAPPPDDVDYTTVTPVNTGATVAGGPLAGTFTVTNTGTDNGADTVFWQAYVSTDATLDGGDVLVDTGSTTALNAGITSGAIGFSGTWPSTAMSYYLIVDVTSDDDVNTGNNDGASGAVAVSAPPPDDIDYETVTPVNTGATVAGGPLAGTFTVTNTGTDNGADTVFWQAYVSTDATLDGGDVLVDTGSTTALNAGITSGAIGFSGTWPSTAMSYYLIVDVTSDDDIDTLNNDGASGAVAVSAPPPDDIDYDIVTPVNTGATVAGGPLAGTFTVTNSGTDNGADTIFWQAYVSTDATLDGGDVLVDTGSRSALNAGITSGAIGFSGTWPSTAMSYYLIVDVASDDDVNTGNNDGASGAVAVSAPPPDDIDYTTVTPVNTGATVAGGPLTGTFTVTNTGADDGADTAFWTAYVSIDATLDIGTDAIVATGSTTALNASQTSGAIPFSGTWPSTAMSYYIIVDVASDDDVNTGNNDGASGAVTVSAPPADDVDYGTVTPVNTGLTVAGGALDGTFTVTNTGADDGADTVFWTAYVSIDATLDIGTDTIVATGSTTALNSTITSAAIPFSGTWPSAAASYYLIVDVVSDDDVSGVNNDGASGAVVVSAPPPDDIDYTTVIPTNTGALVSGATLDGNFTVTNTGADDGADSVFWSAYVSTDTTLDGGDTLVDTGTTGFLAASATSGALSFSGTWPTTPGNYYLIVDVSSDDDVNTGNNNGASGMVTTTGPPPDDVDYLMNAPANTGGTVAGAALSGTFVIDNLGVDAGSLDIAWQLYVSTDAIIDTGIDPLVASNTTSALAGGGSTGAIGFTGTWPSAPGSYYLLAKLSASDDIASGNDTAASGSIVVSAPPPPDIDYTTVTPVNTGATVADGALDGTFTITNTGADDGSDTVFWTAYVSIDATLDIGIDTIVDTGSTTKLNASVTSGPIAFSGTWPSTPASYYLIVDVISDDDVNTGNNDGASGAVAVSAPPPPNIDYGNVTVSNTGGTTTDAGMSGSFTVQNIGTADGSDTIYWWAYISDDSAIGGDIIVDSGTTTSLNQSVTSGAIPFTGTWPSIEQNYWLVVVVSAADDIGGANNDGITAAPVAVTAPPAIDVDYTNIVVSNATPVAATSSVIAESFTFYNAGANSGTLAVTWNAYRSTDTILDGTDVWVDGGTTSALTTLATSSPILIDGLWPASAGVYRLIVTVSAGDETNGTNNQGTSGSFDITTPGTIDYVVTDVSAVHTVVTTGSALAETFDLQNVGDTDGTTVVNWTAYISDDTIIDVGTDAEISGSVPLLTAGTWNKDIDIIGVWPGTAASYYIIVEVTADEAAPETANNITYSGPFTVNDPPDYSVVMTAPNFPPDSLAGSGYGGDFTIDEINGFPGTQAIGWAVLLSDDKGLGNDITLASGTTAPLDASGTISGGALSFSDTWSAIPGERYYIIIAIDAPDDSNPTNDVYISDLYVTCDIVEPGANNDDQGPTNVALPNTTDLGAQGGGTVIIVQGTTDAVGVFDTYKVQFSPPAASALSANAEWSSGTDALDLYIWDELNFEAMSIEVAPDIEPDAGYLGVTGWSNNEIGYVGVKSFQAGVRYYLWITLDP